MSDVYPTTLIEAFDDWSHYIEEGPEGKRFVDKNFTLRSGECESVRLRSDKSGQVSYEEQNEIVKKPLQDRVHRVNEEHVLTHYLVDGVVDVRCFSEPYKKVFTDFWAQKKNLCSLGFVSHLLLSSALPLQAICSDVTPTPILFLTVFTLSICGVALAIKIFIREKQAHTQIEQWQKNLCTSIAQQRKEAFNHGLNHIISQDARDLHVYNKPFTSVLSDVEIDGIYKDYLKKVVLELHIAKSTTEKIAMIKRLAFEGPLRASFLHYVNKFPQGSSPIYPFYEQASNFEQLYSFLAEKKDEAIQSSIVKANSNIERINTKKRAALLVVETTYKIYETNAKAKLDELRMTAGENEHINLNYDRDQHREIWHQAQLIRDALKNSRLIRNAAVAATGIPFDLQINNINHDLDEHIANINKNFDSQLIPIYESLLKLHEGALQAVNGQTTKPHECDFDCLRVPFGEFKDYPIPRAPKLGLILAEDNTKISEEVLAEMSKIYDVQASTTEIQ